MCCCNSSWNSSWREIFVNHYPQKEEYIPIHGCSHNGVTSADYDAYYDNFTISKSYPIHERSTLRFRNHHRSTGCELSGVISGKDNVGQSYR
eukprot:UN05354